MRLDVLIRGGLVYDGLSGTGLPMDVGVLDGRLVLPAGRDPKGGASTRVSFGADVHAARVIDAAGKAVMPGFIDVHTHSELTWLIWPNATSKLLSGVTTDVAGNCGSSSFPLAGETLARRRAECAKHKLLIDWSDAAGYFDRLKGTACSVNRAVLVGHGNLRGVTVGYGDRKATAGEQARMRELLADGLAAGAFGLSSGLIYPPGCFADTDELADLAAVTARFGGLYASHIRDESDKLLEAVDEFIEVIGRARCRGLISHLKTSGPSNWHKIGALKERLHAARTAGLDLWADRYPYTATCTGLSAMLLSRWAIQGTTDEIVARLADPCQRQRIAQELRQRHPQDDFFDRIRLTNFGRPGFAEYSGLSLTELGQRRSQGPLEAALDLLVADRLETEAVHFCLSEDNLAEIYRWPFVMVGSDYSAQDALSPGESVHPRAFGTPAAFLGRFVRQRGVCDWPTAARKLSTMPADMLGLTDRGRIAPGCAADLVVLDPAKVEDRATYQQPRQTPAGIEHVLVNGAVAVDAGQFTGAMAGRVLRRR